MVAVSVRTGSRRLLGMTAALPVTIITAIVSPKTRPMPSMAAAMMPGRAPWMTTR